MSHLPDLSKLRGMSEPFFFTFTAHPKSRGLLCHGVIFVSLRIPGGEETVKLLEITDDARAAHLVHYLHRNFAGAKSAVKRFIEKSVKEADLLEQHSQIQQLEDLKL